MCVWGVITAQTIIIIIFRPKPKVRRMGEDLKKKISIQRFISLFLTTRFCFILALNLHRNQKR